MDEGEKGRDLWLSFARVKTEGGATVWLLQSSQTEQNWAAFKRVKVQNHHDITGPREDW